MSWPGALLVVVGLGTLPGCNIVRGLGVLFAPPQVQKAEYKLTPGRLAVLVETRRPEDYNPVFVDALQTRLQEIFTEEEIKTQIVPQEEILRLRQQNPDFARWSLQKIGRSLNAPYVLSLSIEQLQLRASPEVPVLEPQVRMKAKLIGSNAPAERARLWPTSAEREGRAMFVKRPAVEASSPIVFDEQAAKLGRDTAWEVAGPFHDVDLETVHMREP
ncbi:MAG: hypothetical protein AB1716_05390 [Planctomycetota bacterium]